MVASTRFHRLFISRGGYTLFMPAIIKVYTEAESHLGIRLAIEYAVNRFFAHHGEAFVYQSMDAMAHIMATANIEAEWVAKSVYALFSSLRKPISPATQDAAGIHNSNKLQEREALLVLTAEEKPQTFLASLRPSGGQGKTPITIDIPEEYEAKRLTVDNFVRLFLTVIAHDLTIIRSEQFLRFFDSLLRICIMPPLQRGTSCNKGLKHWAWCSSGHRLKPRLRLRAVWWKRILKT